MTILYIQYIHNIIHYILTVEALSAAVSTMTMYSRVTPFLTHLAETVIYLVIIMVIMPMYC